MTKNVKSNYDFLINPSITTNVSNTDVQVYIAILRNIMDSLHRLSVIYGTWYLSEFNEIEDIKLDNTDQDKAIRRKIAILFNNYFKELNEALLNSDIQTLLAPNIVHMVDECNQQNDVYISSYDIFSTFAMLTADIGFMLKDSDTSKWKDRYFDNIEKDIIKIFNEIDMYRLQMSTVYLCNTIEIIKPDTKIRSTKDISRLLLAIFKEIDKFYKDSSYVSNEIIQTGIDLSNPMEFCEDCCEEGNIADILNFSPNFNSNNDDLPDDF